MRCVESILKVSLVFVARTHPPPCVPAGRGMRLQLVGQAQDTTTADLEEKKRRRRSKLRSADNVSSSMTSSSSPPSQPELGVSHPNPLKAFSLAYLINGAPGWLERPASASRTPLTFMFDFAANTVLRSIGQVIFVDNPVGG